MRSVILNRDFNHPADGWYQIEVPGEHLNKQSGLVQVIDSDAVSSIVNRFNQEADGYKAKYGTDFPGMLIDHEHFKHDADKETIAYGWLMRLENRDGKPYGKINWTNTGKPAVDGGDYRFFSTEYNPKEMQILNARQNPPRMRPLRLDGLTLTNDPQNVGGSPITNRHPSFGSHETESAWNAAADSNRQHIEANKAAYQQAEMERQESSEGEADEFSNLALEKFCRAVKSVMESAGKSGHQMMDMTTAWTYAQTKFPDLYAAAFDPESSADGAETSGQVTALANRIGALAGKNFSFGFNFVQSELPQVFNRMTPKAARIRNRAWWSDRQFSVKKAATIFNRLVRAESAMAGIPDAQAWGIVHTRHPGIYGLMTGKFLPSDAIAMEPGISALMSEK